MKGGKCYLSLSLTTISSIAPCHLGQAEKGLHCKIIHQFSSEFLVAVVAFVVVFVAFVTLALLLVVVVVVIALMLVS